jgi:hypothetical protein
MASHLARVVSSLSKLESGCGVAVLSRRAFDPLVTPEVKK